MRDYDGYLTKKATPDIWATVLENAAVAALLLMMMGCCVVAFFGFLEDGLVLTAHLMLLAILLVLLIPMNLLLERKRARKHAEVVVDALMAARDGSLPLQELESITGVRDAEKTVNQLLAKGYVQHVSIRQGLVILMPE